MGTGLLLLLPKIVSFPLGFLFAIITADRPCGFLFL